MPRIGAMPFASQLLANRIAPAIVFMSVSASADISNSAARSTN